MTLDRDWIPSPNHSGRSGRPRLVVVHTAEGSRTYPSLGAFFANPSAGVSSQTGIDDTPGRIGAYVDDARASWTQAEFNSASISTELCAFADWSRAEWLAHPVMLENCRQWIAEACSTHGIPRIRIGASAAQGSGSGVCGHVDLGARGGGHYDPGPEFPWDICLGGGTPLPPAIPPGLNAAIVDLCALGRGYAMVAADGGVFCFGDAPFHGSLGDRYLNAPIVGMAASANGYWLAGGDGGVFAFGDAPFEGSMGASPKPAVGIAATWSGRGYWLADANGGVYTFGDAPFHGSLGGKHLNAPIVDIAASGRDGYLLVASDGGVFAFGTAFHGSAGGSPLNQPVNAVVAKPDGSGYWLVAADGGVFAYGSAAFAGGMGGEHMNWPAIGIDLDPDGSGYWIGASDGGVFSFDAPFHGSVPSG